MKETLINFETAKLAKGKGFDWECNYTFTSEKGDADFFDDIENWNEYDDNCSAPTQSLLQKWLREEHNIDVQSYLVESLKTIGK